MSDQGLHYLLTDISVKNRTKMKKYSRHLLNEIWTHPIIKNDMVHWAKRVNIPFIGT